MASGHEDTFHHVRDFPYFELPGGVKLELPYLEFLPSGHKLGLFLQGELEASQIWGLQLTKFMVLQVVAALLVLWIFWGLSRRVRDGEPAQGRWWNFWETLALFIRDEVVRPAIGHGHHHDDHGDGHAGAYDAHPDPEHSAGLPEPHGGVHVDPQGAHLPAVGHPADRYLPFIWSCFFYVLICNLLGAVPWMGSATGNLNVTGMLALVTFGMVTIVGTQASGVVGYWASLAPSMDLPGPLKIFLVPMIWVIEFIGLIIKHGVLAVRLFANIMAGHTVIAVVLGFIAAESIMGTGLWYAVMPASIFGQIAIGLLELFVAFLQAYVFAFLASLFISAAVHPH